MKIVTLTLQPDQSLFHGSPVLFEYPHLPRNIENRFSCEKTFPLYYATKSCSSSPGEGYMYEYKIDDDVVKKHGGGGGIPEFIFLTGSANDSINHYISMMYSEPIVHDFTDNEIRNNTSTSTRRGLVRTNQSQNDLELGCIARTKYNGIYVPGYENQLLICGERRPQWLKIVNIFRVVKGSDGKIVSTLFKSFNDVTPKKPIARLPHRPLTPTPSPPPRQVTPNESVLDWKDISIVDGDECRTCNVYTEDKPSPLSLSDIFGEDIFRDSGSSSSSGYDSASPPPSIDYLFENERKEGEKPFPVHTKTPVSPPPPVSEFKKSIRNKKGDIYSTINTNKSTDSWETSEWHHGMNWDINNGGWQQSWGQDWKNGKHHHHGKHYNEWDDETDRDAVETKTGEDPIIKFYRNEVVTKAKRKLSTIWNWNDEKLECQHDFVQWLFPLNEKSRFNSDAPILTKKSIEIIKYDKEIQANLRTSFDKMFAFYGWKVNDTLDGVERMTIEVTGENGDKETRLKPMVWIRHSHNFDRITRILTSMKLLGRTDLSELFFMAMCRTAKGPKARKLIASSFMEYWLPTQEHFLPTNVLEAYCNDITERRKALNETSERNE